MKISVFGAGYVGLVTGVCLAELGNDVVCVDIDAIKIADLLKGISPIYEPGLAELLSHNLQLGRIHFTTCFEQGVRHGLCQIIAVGTPSGAQGAADLGAVHFVAKKIGQMMQSYCLVINKSTVPVGTADEVRLIIHQELANRSIEVEFDIASNPEFLREGAAIEDFMQPDRIIVGADNNRALDYLRELYMPLIDSGKRFVVMDTRSSELTKYASNAFLATKISFINEMSTLAEKLGADIEQVRAGMCMDPRIGEHFLYPGCGYGGSCFPKDIQALQRSAKDLHVDLKILSAVQKVNLNQKQLLVKKLAYYFKNELDGKVIALWGLAFKPHTDDMRDASSRTLIEALLAQGAKIQAYDPVANNKANGLYGHHPGFTIGDTAEAVLENADVLVIVTEWPQFRSANLKLIQSKLRYPAIFDGRNIYDPHRMSESDLSYFAIGRGDPLIQAEKVADLLATEQE